MHHKWQSYDVWFLRYGAQQTECFVILDHFLPFYPLMDPQNQNFRKMNNTPEDIIILQMCTINDSHKMYGSWDMKCNRHNFLFFALLPPNNPKNQNFEKLKKNAWRYYHFTHLYHNWQSNDVWFLRYWAQQTDFFVILDHVLPFHPP